MLGFLLRGPSHTLEVRDQVCGRLRERVRITRKQPGVRRHDGIRNNIARVIEMYELPILASPSSLAREVGTDASRAPELWNIVGSLPRLAWRTKAPDVCC